MFVVVAGAKMALPFNLHLRFGVDCMPCYWNLLLRYLEEVVSLSNTLLIKHPKRNVDILVSNVKTDFFIIGRGAGGFKNYPYRTPCCFRSTGKAKKYAKKWGTKQQHASDVNIIRNTRYCISVHYRSNAQVLSCYDWRRKKRNQIALQQHRVPSVATNWRLSSSISSQLYFTIHSSPVPPHYWSYWPNDDNFCHSNQLPNDSMESRKKRSVQFNQQPLSRILWHCSRKGYWLFVIEITILSCAEKGKIFQ